MANSEAVSLVDKSRNRRRAVRYSHGNLFVIVKRRKLIGMFLKPCVVNWMNFSRFGMAFVSEYKFNIGDELIIDLTISDVNVNKEAVSGVTGIVIHVRKEYSGNYRYGIEFDFDSNEYMKSVGVKKSLDNIEFMLKNIFLQLTERQISGKKEGKASQSSNTL